MGTVYIMKIGPYDLTEKKSKFENVKRLGLQENNPGINQKLIESCIDKNFNFKKIDRIFSSDLLRAKETVMFLKKRYLREKAKITYFPILREILFNAKKFCREKKYNIYGSSIIRKSFMEFFEKDKLPEKSREILKKFKMLKKIIKRHEKENILIISHTFFIKLFLIFLDDENIFINKKKIRKYINPNKRIMDFCHIMKITKFKKCERL